MTDRSVPKLYGSWCNQATCTNPAHSPTSNPTFHLWKAAGPQACWEIISQASEWGNSITARREIKDFFNGEKWEAGEELAVEARIIDGNCWGRRLRFMRRTTHWGAGEKWCVCARGMRDMRQNFDQLVSLIDKPVIPDAAETKKNLHREGFLLSPKLKR